MVECSVIDWVDVPLHIVCVKGELVMAGAGFTVTFTVAIPAGQGPSGSLVVSVTVTVPEVIEGV